MDYPVAIAPELGLSAQDFVDAWNNTPASRALAEAQLTEQPPPGFPLDPGLIQAGLALVSTAVGVATGIAIDTLKDMTKDTLAEYLKQKLSRQPSIKVEAIRQPDGAYLLVVTEEHK